MEVKYYGTMIDGQYLKEKKGDNWIISPKFEDFHYSENRDNVVNFIQQMKKKFPKNDIKLAVCTVEAEDV